MSEAPTRSGERAPERPTLKTIAQATGLAVATVSRALHDAPDIGEQTKARVREVARELGYRPNRAGVRLRTGKTNVISLVLSTEEHVMNHTAQLIYSISNALRGTPYHMIVTPFTSADDPMDPIRYIVETRSADGVIINQTRPDDPRVRYMIERGFPFATHGRTGAGLEHPYFDFDNIRFTDLAVQALAARGRRRLALVAPPLDQSYGDHMATGFAAAAERLGCRHTVFAGITSDSSIARVEADVTAVMAAADYPDGLVIGSASATMAAVTAAEAAGKRLGRDIDIVSKEAVPLLKYFRKELIVVPENVAEAGDFLAHALIAAIERPDDAYRQHLDVPTLEVDAGRVCETSGT